ncbi:MAG: hypothetical protein ACRCX8_10310 [Sarcina sp.]
MILEEVIGLLSANNVQVEAFSTNKTSGIVYEFANLTSDKIKRQDRFSLTIIDKNYHKALETSEKLKEILLTLADNRCTMSVNSVELSGGGTMYFEDTNTYHVKQIYTLKSKEKRGTNNE